MKIHAEKSLESPKDSLLTDQGGLRNINLELTELGYFNRGVSIGADEESHPTCTPHCDQLADGKERVLVMPSGSVAFDTTNNGLNSSEYAYSIVFAAPLMAANLDEPRGSERFDELRSSSFEDGPSWKKVKAATWLSVGDGEEIANVVDIAWLESMTEQQYRRFTKVRLSTNGIYKGFSDEEIPPLEWVKLQYPNQAAVAQYWRKRLSGVVNRHSELNLTI
jgi:hypothetical protein